ncbi:hypothetical protein [Arthrobacter sp. CJ23]|uniref:hypothetical protein n=1 Tax=Arthrobacter sp. CJ23 TaxID=2972479 RepID=UPI00215BEDCB|nr:hypothetical protein [Arthrobacter sp. CJ23]UVJ38294.1 hypothetical protein NVV90_13700 [Arthrobacter sp. CJ23]
MKKIGLHSLPIVLTMLVWQLTARVNTALGRGASATDHRERGDVPGWVMITLMSAVLVAGLLAVATPALEGLFNQAMDKVGK